ncbi:hypothetical protein AB4431_01375 [Vibrio artabrorum]|uniref:hypothetical protein n=1 Tax=Vibrio artabrorum TaxID=446374 RepID=UPI00354F71FD
MSKDEVKAAAKAILTLRPKLKRDPIRDMKLGETRRQLDEYLYQKELRALMREEKQ